MSKNRVTDKPLSGNPIDATFDGPNYFSSKHWDRKAQIIAEKCGSRLTEALDNLDVEGGVDVIANELATTANLLSTLLRGSRLAGWEAHELEVLLHHVRCSLESASERLSAIQSYHVARSFAEGEAVDELGNAARLALGFRTQHANVTASTKALRKLVMKLPDSARKRAELELGNIDEHMGTSYDPDAAPESAPAPESVERVRSSRKVARHAA